jgi:hypothetical protein
MKDLQIESAGERKRLMPGRCIIKKVSKQTMHLLQNIINHAISFGHQWYRIQCYVVWILPKTFHLCCMLSKNLNLFFFKWPWKELYSNYTDLLYQFENNLIPVIDFIHISVSTTARFSIVVMVFSSVIDCWNTAPVRSYCKYANNLVFYCVYRMGLCKKLK